MVTPTTIAATTVAATQAAETAAWTTVSFTVPSWTTVSTLSIKGYEAIAVHPTTLPVLGVIALIALCVIGYKWSQPSKQELLEKDWNALKDRMNAVEGIEITGIPYNTFSDIIALPLSYESKERLETSWTEIQGAAIKAIGKCLQGEEKNDGDLTEATTTHTQLIAHIAVFGDRLAERLAQI